MPEKIKTHIPASNHTNADTQSRKDDTAFYCQPRWRKLAHWKRQQQPICQVCKGLSGTKINVHHVISRKERPDLAFDETNLAVLCASCHLKEENNRRTKGNGNP